MRQHGIHWDAFFHPYTEQGERALHKRDIQMYRGDRFGMSQMKAKHCLISKYYHCQ